jgi:hypothetical protein
LWRCYHHFLASQSCHQSVRPMCFGDWILRSLVGRLLNLRGLRRIRCGIPTCWGCSTRLHLYNLKLHIQTDPASTAPLPQHQMDYPSNIHMNETAHSTSTIHPLPTDQHCITAAAKPQVIIVTTSSKGENYPLEPPFIRCYTTCMCFVSRTRPGIRFYGSRTRYHSSGRPLAVPAIRKSVSRRRCRLNPERSKRQRVSSPQPYRCYPFRLTHPNTRLRINITSNQNTNATLCLCTTFPITRYRPICPSHPISTTKPKHFPIELQFPPTCRSHK